MKKSIAYSSIILASAALFSCGRSGNTSQSSKVISYTNVYNEAVAYDTVYDIDSNAYKTVKIGKYTWFCTNLKATKLNDGTPVELVTDNKAWKTTKKPAYSAYNNQNDSVFENGLLYNWATVETGKICPGGWSVPCDSAWEDLAAATGGLDTAAISLKSVQAWTGGATNASGFSAIPSGFRERNGKFYIQGENGFWWSSTPHNAANAMYLYIDKNKSINHSHIDRRDGLSIRCVKE